MYFSLNWEDPQWLSIIKYTPHVSSAQKLPCILNCVQNWQARLGKLRSDPTMKTAYVKILDDMTKNIIQIKYGIFPHINKYWGWRKIFKNLINLVAISLDSYALKRLIWN